jgi:hypothetical protein
MKKFALKAIAIGVFSFGLLLTQQSCSDPCKDVTCDNGGTCEEGTCKCATGFFGDNCQTECKNGGTGTNSGCTCATGYEGTKCETKMADKFVASFKYNETTGTGCGVSDWPVTISASSSAINKILINGFGGFGCNGVNIVVEATVNGKDITVANQTFCSGGLTIKSGTGTMNASNTSFTVNYTYNDGSGDVSCGGTYTKQ